jgi:hypothetical protein
MGRPPEAAQRYEGVPNFPLQRYEGVLKFALQALKDARCLGGVGVILRVGPKLALDCRGPVGRNAGW